MKLLSYRNRANEERAGLHVGGKDYDLVTSGESLGLTIPLTLIELLRGGEPELKKARQVEAAILGGKAGSLAQVAQPLAPIPHPPTVRDGYAFRQHVETMRRFRGAEMIPEFDQFPVFYFTNHHAIVGAGDVVVEQDHLQRLDYELELAVVIGKAGRNIRSENAEQHIAGFTIMNDFTARLLAVEEMKLTMGPAKGKDFATALGPWLVTLDELASFRVETPFGPKWNVEMKAYHNDKLVTHGNAGSMSWTFSEIIERAAYGVELQVGDVIGSGTVGRGCFAEQNLVGEVEAKQKGESFTPTWLKPGDRSCLEISGLGKLHNQIVLSKDDFSILARRKHV